jgi:glutaconyl-CoA/methylmalonyl-CoA decarboxylase subunit gamma
MEQINITVNGKSYAVEIGDWGASTSLQVIVNGKSYEVTLEGEDVKTAAPAQKLAAATGSAPAAPVISTAPIPAALPSTARTPAAVGSVNEVRSPMPGTILDIAVKTGDQVKVGQTLCALEAMKMKSAIRSPRDGTIANVAVSEGQKVAYNDVLVKFA